MIQLYKCHHCQFDWVFIPFLPGHRCRYRRNGERLSTNFIRNMYTSLSLPLALSLSVRASVLVYLLNYAAMFILFMRNMCSAHDFLSIFDFQSHLYEFFILSLLPPSLLSHHYLMLASSTSRNFLHENVKSFPLKCLRMMCLLQSFISYYDIMSITNDSFTLSFYERIVKRKQSKANHTHTTKKMS